MKWYHSLILQEHWHGFVRDFTKLEIRMSKYETHLKCKTRMFQTENSEFSTVFDLVIWICFGFRYSSFGFDPRISAQNVASLWQVQTKPVG